MRQVSGNHPLTTTLLRKFNANLSLIPLADALPHLHATTLDRIIEPLELTEDYKYLIGWEPAKNRQGQFKISRMMDVDILEEPITTTHEPSPMDIFGLTGDKWHDVKMKLSPLSYSLLAEEFPLSMGFVRRDKSSKRIHIRNCNYFSTTSTSLEESVRIRVKTGRGFNDFCFV